MKTSRRTFLKAAVGVTAGALAVLLAPAKADSEPKVCPVCEGKGWYIEHEGVRQTDYSCSLPKVIVRRMTLARCPHGCKGVDSKDMWPLPHRWKGTLKPARFRR